MTRYQWAVLALLAGLTAVLFSPVAGYPFINFDDTDYVTKNPVVQGGLTAGGLKWAFQTTSASNWHPLTWFSHMLDCQLFGLWAGGHHLTNLALHVANAVLLFFFLSRSTRAFWPSVIAAALFAWHPLRIESVVWISERKDVLSAFFGLLSLCGYSFYVDRPHPTRYLLVLAAFICSLLAKPMLVTFPFLLLLLDFWPLRRPPFAPNEPFDLKSRAIRSALGKLLLEKVPFLVLSIVSALITFHAQKAGGAVASMGRIPIETRMANALCSYADYLWQSIWPVKLAVFYPHPLSVSTGRLLLAMCVVLGLFAVVVRVRRRYLTVGWFWYLGLLVPVIGLVQVGDQAMADRYTYLPLVGIYIGVVWGIEELARWRYGLGRAATALALCVAIALMVCTRWQLTYWQNAEHLFTRALEVTKNNYVAHNNLGNVLDISGRRQEAKAHYQETLRIRPDFAGTHYNLANVFAQEKNFPEALDHYRLAVALSPSYADAHYNLGVVLATVDQLAEGIEHHRIAIRCRPGFAEAHHNLGSLLVRQGKLDEAADAYEEAIRIRPAWAEALIDLGSVLERMGRNDEAVQRYFEAVRLDPRSAHAHSNLGILLARLGHFDAAVQHLAAVVGLDPNNADARYNFGNVLAEKGDLREAAEQYEHAAGLNPNDSKAREKLAKLKARL